MALPQAVLFDLDDTILNDTGHVEACWGDACVACDEELRARSIDRATLLASIPKSSDWYWSDPERNRRGRLDLKAARREVARLSLLGMGIDDSQMAATLGDAYNRQRVARMAPFPAAVSTLRWLKSRGCRLGLVTNGGGTAQRNKLARFALSELFGTILIEGELGFGKPDPRVYEMALRELSVSADATWMVGDNLDFDVVAPQRLGLFGIWIDSVGGGVPEGHPARPNRIVRTIAELQDL